MEETIIQEKESKWYVLRVVSGKERKIKEYLHLGDWLAEEMA